MEYKYAKQLIWELLSHELRQEVTDLAFPPRMYDLNRIEASLQQIKLSARVIDSVTLKSELMLFDNSFFTTQNDSIVSRLLSTLCFMLVLWGTT